MQWLRGSALALLGRWQEARVVYARLAGDTMPTAVAALSELGVVNARGGSAQAARKASDDLARMNRPYIRGAHTLGRAHIAAALGERERTVDLLREAFAEGQALAWPLHSDYAIESMHGCAPFENWSR